MKENSTSKQVETPQGQTINRVQRKQENFGVKYRSRKKHERKAQSINNMEKTLLGHEESSEAKYTWISTVQHFKKYRNRKRLAYRNQ